MIEAWHTIPGYAWHDWTIPSAATIPAGVKRIGGTGCMLQQQRYMRTQTSATVVDGTPSAAVTPQGVHTVQPASLRAMAAAVVAAGLKLGYKPHVSMPNDAAGYVPQANTIPGGIYSNSARYTAGQPVELAAHGMDGSWVGARVANPNPGHYAPGDQNTPTGMDAYGTTAPTFVTVTGIVDVDHFTISRPVTQTLGGSSSICIVHPSKARPWFDAYKVGFDADMAVLQENGRRVDVIDISTEHNYSTIMLPDLWREFVAYVRGKYPTARLVCSTGGTSDLFASVTFWDLLDALTCTDYPSVQTSSTSQDSRAQVDAKWSARFDQYAAAQSAWRTKTGRTLPVWLGETGARSIENAGNSPLSYSGGTYSTDTQRLYLDSFLRTAKRRASVVAGFAWWTTVHANPGNVNAAGVISEVGQTTYSITGKPAGTAHAQHMHAAPISKLLRGSAIVRLSPSGPSGTNQPTGPGITRIQDVYVAGVDTFASAMDKITGTASLPDDVHELNDFAYGGQNGYSISARMTGIAANNAIIQMRPGSSTKVGLIPSANPNTNPLYMLRTTKSPAGGFTMQGVTLVGTEQPVNTRTGRPHAYGGLMLDHVAGWRLVDVRTVGIPGDGNTPPDETFAVNAYGGTDGVAQRCSGDGRIGVGVPYTPTFYAAGDRVGASPFGANSEARITLLSCAFRYSRASMPTFWQTDTITTVDLVSEYHGSGTGSLSGHGVNHERCSGVIDHTRPTITIDRPHGNNGLHMSFLSDLANIDTMFVRNPTWDHIPGTPMRNCFGVQMKDITKTYQTGMSTQAHPPHVFKADGSEMAQLSGNAIVGTPDPAASFIYFL